MKKYDTILIGGGIANIALALELSKTNPDILMIEAGPGLNYRRCLKQTFGKCVHCNPCHITQGFGGAGCYSDCKLTYSSEVGGSLIDYVGKDTFNGLLNEADALFTEYGGKQNLTKVTEFADQFDYECSKFGMKLLKFGVRHLGTDGAYNLLSNMYDTLVERGVKILKSSQVTNIDFNTKTVYIKNFDEEYTANHISIGVGRSGAEWLRQLCVKNNIPTTASSVDVGVRLECPRSITDFATDKLYEFKIINYSSAGNKVRTFCVNPGGYVVQENYDNCVCVNGHSLSDNKTHNTNFSLLVSLNFTKPFNEPIKYATSICQLTNMLADGKVMVQRLTDLKHNKRSTATKMQRLTIEPTLKDAEPGDLRYALPSNVIDALLETIDNLNNVFPGINGSNTLLYAPEVKFYSSKIELNNKLQSNKYDDIYFIGDSSGITHGIMQSVMSGLYVAKQIKERN